MAYAEANGHATEALSNVRTVKAMSTEAQGTMKECCRHQTLKIIDYGEATVQGKPADGVKLDVSLIVEAISLPAS